MFTPWALEGFWHAKKMRMARAGILVARPANSEHFFGGDLFEDLLIFFIYLD